MWNCKVLLRPYTTVKLILKSSFRRSTASSGIRKNIPRKAYIQIHLKTKMNDMPRCFEVILTSFSSDKCHGQFKFKIKWLFIPDNVSQWISAHALKCSKQILSHELSPIVCRSTSVSSHRWKAFHRLDSQAFPGIL